MPIKHVSVRFEITRDKREEKQADGVGIQHERVRRRLSEYRSLQTNPVAVIVSAGGVISQTAPQVCWSTASLGHLSVLTRNSRWPLHSAVCSFSQQDPTWQVKSLWTVLVQLMASCSWCVWVCVHLRGKMSNTCKIWKDMHNKKKRKNTEYTSQVFSLTH